MIGSEHMNQPLPDLWEPTPHRQEYDPSSSDGSIEQHTPGVPPLATSPQSSPAPTEVANVMGHWTEELPFHGGGGSFGGGGASGAWGEEQPAQPASPVDRPHGPSTGSAEAAAANSLLPQLEQPPGHHGSTLHHPHDATSSGHLTKHPHPRHRHGGAGGGLAVELERLDPYQKQMQVSASSMSPKFAQVGLHLTPEIIMATAMQESGGSKDPKNVKSFDNGLGIMQVTPSKEGEARR